jgi:hypothetical protein
VYTTFSGGGKQRSELSELQFIEEIEIFGKLSTLFIAQIVGTEQSRLKMK